LRVVVVVVASDKLILYAMLVCTEQAEEAEEETKTK